MRDWEEPWLVIRTGTSPPWPGRSFLQLAPSPLCCCLCMFSDSFSSFFLPAFSAPDMELPSAPPFWVWAKGPALSSDPLSCSHLSTVSSSPARSEHRAHFPRACLRVPLFSAPPLQAQQLGPYRLPPVPGAKTSSSAVGPHREVG